jgi:kumamolisin
VPGKRSRPCAVLVLSVVTVTAMPAQTNPGGTQTLAGHVPLEVRNGTAVLRYHASVNIDGRIILPLRNQPELAELLEDLYNPNSPKFHKFLTPDEFAQRFSADAADSMQVREFLKAAGIFVTGQSGNGTVLRATGPSEAYERAFGLRINYYPGKDDAMFFAPDMDPTIPAALAGKILAIGGLDNLPLRKTHPRTESPGPPSDIITPGYLKVAYNLNSIPADGSGQTIALFELEGFSPTDMAAYEGAFGFPQVPLQTILIDGFNGVPVEANDDALEVTADIELVTAFAPGSSILVYETLGYVQNWIDAWARIAEDNKARVISVSLGGPEKMSPWVTSDSQVLQQMAAQGQAVFVASRDSGAFAAGGTTLEVDEPASQPYATGAGESFLGTNGDGSYSSESARVGGTFGSGGGISAIFPIPSYQTTMASQAAKAALVSTTMRNVPDVVVDGAKQYTTTAPG